VEETGHITGYYCSELGRVDPDSCHPLTGWIVGDVVGFSVRFDPPGSITSWSGQISEDAEGPYLRTLWNLSRNVPDPEEPDRLWESVISGYAVFRPVAALTPDLKTPAAE
ncbi:MAG: avidin/streptavidin family protein, partial [Pseudomonadota bacterium]